MLGALLLLGLFDAPAGVGTLIAPADAIATIPLVAGSTPIGTGIPLGAPVWKRSLDPNDQGPYAWDFSPLLDAGAKIASIERLTMSAAGASVGVQIVNSGACSPIITDDGDHVQVWFAVDPAQQAAAVFSAAGLQVPVAALIVTDQNPPRKYERTAVLPVRQL